MALHRPLDASQPRPLRADPITALMTTRLPDLPLTASALTDDRIGLLTRLRGGGGGGSLWTVDIWTSRCV